MRYAAYLRWEGGGSVVLGLALALVAVPGLVVSYDAWWVGLLFVPAVLLALGGWAAARGTASLLDPGGWLTARPLAGATPGRAGLPEGRLRRRLAVESGLWIVLVCGWVLLARQSGLLVFGTGLASVAYGLVQVLGSAARVRAVERERGASFVVARRPGLGLPELGVEAA